MTFRCDCPEHCDAFPDQERYQHTLRLSELRDGQTLLGSASTLCAAFFHWADTPEAGLSLGCLRDGVPCSGKTTVCIAVLRQLLENQWQDVYIARYKNCSSGANCAEDSLLVDETLLLKMQRACQSQLLTIYINKQPCHKSTSTRADWSCTEALIAFGRSHALSIDLVVAYPYRAHWDKRTVRPELRNCIENARIGLQILRHAEGLRLRAFDHADWDFLIELCDDAVKIDYRSAEPRTLHARIRAQRLQMDTFAAACFSERAWWLLDETS